MAFASALKRRRERCPVALPWHLGGQPRGPAGIVPPSLAAVRPGRRTQGPGGTGRVTGPVYLAAAPGPGSGPRLPAEASG
ncbi:hypothetical protein [Streptomyces longisporoflavus]|uniref:Uncharacterized protein n=1 Tax=Streptomyces longisporoflavus TaxID=28044 RepID=A0ABW7R8U3_9ACTN